MLRYTYISCIIIVCSTEPYIVAMYFDRGTATLEDTPAGCDGGSRLVRRLAGVVEVTVEGHPGSGSILGLLLREIVICDGGVDRNMEHSRLAICEEGMLFPFLCV